MRAPSLHLFLLTVATLAAYHNSFSGAFVFDDEHHILENPDIRQFWPPQQLLGNTSRPLVYLSLALNHALSGFQPWSYHAFNLLVHLLAGLTLYGLLRRTLRLPSVPLFLRPGAEVIACAASLLWLVHPLQTSSVTYIIQRAEVLMGLFYLLVLYCLVRSKESPSQRLWPWGAVAACSSGMLTKPIMVTAPLVALVFDRIFLSGSFSRLWRTRRTLHCCLAATLLLLPLLLWIGQQDWRQSVGWVEAGITPLRYGQVQLNALVRYLRLALWPHPLVFDYGWPTPPQRWQFFAAALGCATIVAVTAGLLRRAPAAGFLGLWFLVILAPTSSVVPIATEMMAEHRMYLPLAAITTAAAIGGFLLIEFLCARWRISRPLLAAGLLSAATTPLLAVTVDRNKDYRDPVTLWEDTVRKLPSNTRAHNNLGRALEQAGRLDKALFHYQQALQSPRTVAVALYNIGAVLTKQQRQEEAIMAYHQALAVNPNYANAHFNLAELYGRLGNPTRAIFHYREAVRIAPDFARAHNNLGDQLLRTGHIAEAIVHFQRAVEIDPHYQLAAENLTIAKRAAAAAPPPPAAP